MKPERKNILNLGIALAVILLALVALCRSAFAQITGDDSLKSSLTGSVLNAITGQPVPAAEVSAAKLSVGDAAEKRVIQSDADGRFAITGLSAGRYVLQASTEGYTVVQSRRGWAIVVLKPSGHVDATLYLEPGGIISGRVVDEAASPVRGAAVQALKYSFREGIRQLEEMASAETNASGEYRMLALVPGQYLIRASSPAKEQAYRRETPLPLSMYYPSATDFTRAIPLAVNAGQELSGVEVKLTPVATFHVRGKVIDTRTDVPVQSAELTLLSDQGNTYYRPTAAATDTQGSFDLTGVTAGSYLLVAQSPTSEPEIPLWGRTAVDISDADAENVRVLIGPGVSVGGRIRAEGDLILSGLEADLKTRESTTLAELMPPVKTAVVNADGTFLFRHVPEGDYDIGFSPLPAGFYLTDDQAEDSIRIGLGVSTQELHPILRSTSASIEGTVTADGPVANAYVVLVPDTKRSGPGQYLRTAVSNQLGRFTLRAIVPGDYRIFACDQIQPSAFRDPDFLRRYEDFGQPVHIDDGTHTSVELAVLRP